MEEENKNNVIKSDIEIEYEDLSLESFDKMLSEQEEIGRAHV